MPPRLLRGLVHEVILSQPHVATRSHACDPITCATGVASIDIIQNEGLIERVARIDELMNRHFKDMLQENELMREYRGLGVLHGVELVSDRKTREPSNAVDDKVVQGCQDNGLLVQARGSHGRKDIVRRIPRMASTDDEIDEGMGILKSVLKSVRT